MAPGAYARGMCRPHPHRPAPAAMTGIALFALMDATMKRASLASDVYNAPLFRSLIGTVLLFPLWRLPGRRDRTAHGGVF